jgi:hypothetical protein
MVSGALLLAVTPLTVAFVAFPQWLAIGIAVVLAAAAIWALATSFVLLWRTRGTPSQGVPIIGCALGAILVTVTLGITVPLAFGG